MSETVIEASDVTRTLGSGAGEVQALKGVSLTVRGGEPAAAPGRWWAERSRCGWVAAYCRSALWSVS